MSYGLSVGHDDDDDDDDAMLMCREFLSSGISLWLILTDICLCACVCVCVCVMSEEWVSV